MPSIDLSRFCRFIFPDTTSAIILTYNSTNTIQKEINRLFAKRGLTWYRTELYSVDQVNGIFNVVSDQIELRNMESCFVDV